MIEYKKISGKIICETGLRIGGKENTAEIGGVDNPVIRNPLDSMPYIPGSSLKGKMRFLLEHKYDKVSYKGAPHSCAKEDCIICKLFGKNVDIKNKDGKLEIGRAIFRDSFLAEKSREKLEELAGETGMYYTERKMENVINRKKGAAKHPREMERVPAGTEFDFTIGLRIFSEDDKKLIDTIENGIKLIEQDALGASGSRGYGKVKIHYEIKE